LPGFETGRRGKKRKQGSRMGNNKQVQNNTIIIPRRGKESERRDRPTKPRVWGMKD